MSFFNFGPSPTKSSDASNTGDGNGDFNMFGGGATGAGSFFGGGNVEPVDSSTGSFFSNGPGPAEAEGSMFGSTGSGTKRQQEDSSPGNAKHGLPGISPPPPAKIIKQDPSQSQPLTNAATWGAPPQTISRPAPSPTTPRGGPPPASSTGGPRPSTSCEPSTVTNSGMRSHQEAQSYGQGQIHQQARPAYEAPSMPNQKSLFPMTESYPYYQSPAQAPSPGNSQTVAVESSVQSSALREEKTADEFKKVDEDEMFADVLLKDMIDMQKQQLYELVPQMKRSEDKSDQILTSASLVLRDVTNYGEKLAVTKKLYCSRLSQVSSCLRMIPKTEK